MAGSPVIKGITTIRWGTSNPNAVLTGGLNTAIVKKVVYKRLGGAPTLIEDNNGFTAVLVGIADGDELQITCVDDTTITWPAQYTVASFQVPGQANAKNFIVVDDGIDLERKREGEKNLTLNWFTNNIA